MSDIHERVARHYGQAGVAEAIPAALAAAGKDVERLAPDDLAPIDEFHTSGCAATVDLAKLLDLKSAHRVLGVGSGIGGPSRFLAHTYPCTVVGLDLTPEFRAAAGPTPLGIHVFMGADWPTMTANTMRNLAEDRIRSHHAVLERV